MQEYSLNCVVGRWGGGGGGGGGSEIPKGGARREGEIP